ncbi:MAG: tetratricopeptide (TPR) repeat protein [Alphaproteobacteria bacterium]|jgi:tetratricopeptide (TPR) repeat protein
MASKKHIRRIEQALAAGDAQTALELCQKRLAINARDADIILLQAQSLLTMGNMSAAIEAVSPLTARAKAPAGAYHIHAHALIQIDQKDKAFEIVKAGLDSHANQQDLLQYAGLLADQLTMPIDSERYFRQLLALNPSHPDAGIGLGNALQQQGRNEEAHAAYLDASVVAPNNPSPMVNAANLWAKEPDQTNAQAAYRAVLKKFPDRADVYANVGASYVLSADYNEAVQAYDSYLKRDPDDFDANLSRAKTLLKAGSAAESVQALSEMAERFPDNPKVCPELINACLSLGDAELAKSHFDAYRARFPYSADVCSCASILHATLHPEKHAQGQAALVAEIQAYDLTPPPEYADAHAFFDDVCAAVYAHPSLMEAPADHATIAGLHTGDLAKEPVATPLAMLIRAIKARVLDYVARPETAANSFFDGFNPERANFNLWAVVMRDGGHQEAHIHPSARLSGVVYGKVPTSIQDSNDRAGWIEFGRPHRDFHQPESLPVKLIKPSMGRIVLFPSHTYHATLPLNGDDHRISLAFDVVG